MDKKYLVETNEMFAMSEMDSVKQSEVLNSDNFQAIFIKFNGYNSIGAFILNQNF